MLIPGRHEASGSYRYGFNGKEKDDEIKGDGVQYDYGFRIYDTRLSKFLSIDPLFSSYPWYTPYQFAGNMPINSIDIDGLEERIVIYAPGQKNPIVYDISNTESRIFENLRIEIYRSIPNVEYFSQRTDFRNFNLYRHSSAGDGKMYDSNRNWMGPKNGVLYIFYTETSEFANYVYQNYDLNLKPKNPTLKDTYKTIVNAAEWYSESNDREAVGFRQNTKNTGIAVTAVVAAPLVVEYGIASQSISFCLAKTSISSVTQAVVNDGKINITSSLADGFLKTGYGDVIGNAVPLNFNIKTLKFDSEENIFNGKLSFEDFMKQTTSDVIFGVKSDFVQGKNPSLLEVITTESSYQFSNYSLQKYLND